MLNMARNSRKSPDLTIRLTPQERRAIDRTAEAEHLSSSTWLRRLGLFSAEDEEGRTAERDRMAAIAARARSDAAPRGGKRPSGTARKRSRR